jgi:hypothetical protein
VVKANEGRWQSAFQKATNRPLTVMCRIQNLHRQHKTPAQFQQSKTAYLSLDKSMVFKNQLALIRMAAHFPVNFFRARYLV